MRVCPNYNNTFKGMNSGVFMGIPFKDAGLSRRKDIKDGEESKIEYGVVIDDEAINKMKRRKMYLQRKAREIKPYTQVERFPCLFRGFHVALGMMLDSGGNECALKTRSYSPCQMEMRGNKPSWSECPFNTEENRTKLAGSLEKIRVFPREFRPPKIKSWEGISLMSWVKYITDGVPIKE